MIEESLILMIVVEELTGCEKYNARVYENKNFWNMVIQLFFFLSKSEGVNVLQICTILWGIQTEEESLYYRGTDKRPKCRYRTTLKYPQNFSMGRINTRLVEVSRGIFVYITIFLLCAQVRNT